MNVDSAWSRLWEVFHAALELPEDAREALLERECAGEPALRQQVSDLLRSHERAGDFLEPPPSRGGAASSLANEAVPDRIGRYIVREKLGEGGFADVYLAEQTEPVQRRVAIKVLKPGMDSRAVIARFEAERQTLALVEHPGIATVLDAGLSAGGRPFVVMELIAGLPITLYCDEHRLDTAARLDLFVQVCHAVQHAHHKGVIHRDLKPSNVMVTEVDGAPQVKVIDFGIARAIDSSARGRTLFTEAGQLVGTPEYMSPEQAAGADLDTRTDVYALGVLLYELLAGMRPFDPERFERATPSEILGVLREQDPVRPSTRLRACEQAAATAFAAVRGAGDAASLARRLRGDLDWIVMKAIEKERTRRYASPSELAADLQRHKGHEPVLAGPPSAIYRLRKFARRNRAAVAGACAALVVTIGAIVHLARTARMETRLRKDAELAGAAAAENQRVAEEVSAFFAREVLAGADPRRASNPDIPMREVVDAAAGLVSERFADEPLIEATIRQTLGDTYRSLGLFDRALPHLERASSLFRAQCGEADLRTLRASTDLAILYIRLDRLDEAERLLREILERQRRSLGPNDRETLRSEVNLGSICIKAGRFADAKRILGDSRAALERGFGPHDEDTILATHHLATAHGKLAEHADAEPLLRSVLEHQEKARGEDHPYTIAALNELAQSLQAQARHAEAEPMFARVLEATLRRSGEEHLDTAIARANLGLHCAKLGRFEDAEPLLRNAASRIEAALGADHASTLDAQYHLATVYHRTKRYAEAEPLFAAVAERGRRVLPHGHLSLGFYLQHHGLCLHRLGRSEEAEPRLAAGLAIIAGVLGPGHASSRTALAELILVHEALGRSAEAEAGRRKLRGLEAAAR
jgi:serine/threonine protein kinase